MDDTVFENDLNDLNEPAEAPSQEAAPEEAPKEEKIVQLFPAAAPSAASEPEPESAAPAPAAHSADASGGDGGEDQRGEDRDRHDDALDKVSHGSGEESAGGRVADDDDR